MTKRKKPDRWMPLYVADYLKKTTNLTTELHGAYLLLLMTYWTRQSPLPNDDRQLAAIAKMGIRRWTKYARPVIEKYFSLSSTEWTHNRAQAEINRAV